MNVFNFNEWSLFEGLDENKYHTYMIYKGSKSKPLYIGYGTPGRTKVSLSNFKKKHGDATLEIMSTHSSKEAAQAKEVKLTNKYKLKSNGGSLLNRKTGTVPSDDLKKTYSKVQKGVKKSPEHKSKISDTLKGTAKSPEHKKNIAAAMKNL